MSSYPFLKIYTCSDDVSDVEFIDIDYSSSKLFNIPKITVATDIDVNVYLSDVTLTTARINFSQKYTGTVKYSVISIK